MRAEVGLVGRAAAVRRARAASPASLLARFGDDQTQATASRPALVFAPHQDDETLGCGVTILRKTDVSTPVWVVFATDGGAARAGQGIAPERMAATRKAEAVEACRRLGVRPERVLHLGFEEGQLERDRDRLARQIAELWARVEPAEVFVSSGLDWHEDHRVLQEVVVELYGGGGLAGELFEYPVWFWSGRWWTRFARRVLARAAGLRWPAGRLTRALRPMVVRTDGFIERKLHALEAHDSQMRNLTGDPLALTLHEVASGTFLPRFFGDYEIFFRLLR